MRPKLSILIAIPVLVLLFANLFINQAASQNSSRAPQYNPLHKAILKGNPALVKRYSIPKYFYDYGESTPSPLQLALYQKRLDLAKIMVKRGLNVDRPFDPAIVPAVIFNAVCDYKWVKFLTDHGAKVNRVSTNLGGVPLIVHAGSCKKPDTIALLLNKGARIESKMLHGSTALASAISRNNLKTARYLIRRGAKMRFTVAHTTTGRTIYVKQWLLSSAVENRNIAMANLLIRKGHPVKPYEETIYKILLAKSNQFKVKNGSRQKMHAFLLTKGLDEKLVKKYTCTALSVDPQLAKLWINRYWKKNGWNIFQYRAAIQGSRNKMSLLSCPRDRQTFQWLLNKGKWPVSPLPYLGKMTRYDEAVKLVKRGRSANGKDYDGRNILFYLQNDSRGRSLRKYFIEKGADINARDLDGNNLFTMTGGSIYRDTKFITYLMKKGFDARAKNKRGKNAVDQTKRLCRYHLSRRGSGTQRKLCVNALAVLTGKPGGRGYKPDSSTKKQTSWKQIGAATSVGYTKKRNGHGYIFEMPMEKYAVGKWTLKFLVGGKFKNIMILGARSKNSSPGTWKILYNGPKKVISTKDLGRAYLNHRVLLIKVNGTKTGFYRLQAKAKIFISYEQ